jgi:hypothetical protein
LCIRAATSSEVTLAPLNNSNVTVYPFYTTPRIASYSQFYSWADYFLRMYVYARGSTIVDVLPFTNDVTTITRLDQTGTIIEDGPLRTAVYAVSGQPTHFRIPYYNINNRSIINCTTNGVPTASADFQLTSVAGSKVIFETRMADDGQMGYFTGCAPLAFQLIPPGRAQKNTSQPHLVLDEFERLSTSSS